MAKDVDLQEVQTNPLSSDRYPDSSYGRPIDHPTSSTPTAVLAAPPTEEVAPTADCPIWEPTEPQFTKAIAEHYSVDGRTVQRTRKKIQEALPWLAERDLKLEDDRYTPLCIKLMGHYWTSGLRISAWKQQMWESHPEVVRAYLESQSAQSETAEPPAIRPDVMPQIDGSLPTGDRTDGMSLHVGSALNLPGIGSFMVPSNDPAYLAQAQQRLEQFAAMQQNVLAQMQLNFQQAQALNAQFKEGMSLSDQLFLKEYELKGVQLGFAAVQIKQEATKATIQATESGTLPVPGKLPVQSTPSPLA